MRLKQKLFIAVLGIVSLIDIPVSAQQKKKLVIDSLDGKFDVSNYLIDAHGFIPVPSVITEPSLGGFGLAVAPVFLKKQSPLKNKDGSYQYIPPDITAALGGFTSNDTWFAGLFRSGTIRKYRVKYKLLSGYADVNISYYKTLALVGEQEFKFNLRKFPIYLSAIKQLGSSDWSMGLQYTYLNTKIALRSSEPLPSFVSEKEVNNNNSVVGYVAELDTRDNIFTPDNGVKFHFDFNWSSHIWGSDNNYSDLASFVYWYKPLSKNWINGLRVELQQAFNDPPFYFLPYVSMRGVPNARYQGKTTLLTEAEERWDIVPRWSLVFFGGVGKAFDKENTFSEVPTVWSMGTGFRYLFARKFKLRMGIDVAHGPDTWAYYIVFGSNWFR